MTTEFSSGHCPHCQAKMKLERVARVWGCGDLFMVVMTCGLWALGRILFPNPWRCSSCGTKIQP